MNDRAITDWEIEQERRHDASAVSHGEYDEETEKMMDKIEALEREVVRLKKEIEALKVKP